MKFIEQLGLREIAITARGNDDSILIPICFIHQARLRFPISPKLKEVMARYGLTFMQLSINFVRTAFVIDTLMQQEGLPFSASDLPSVYSVVRPKREPSTNLFMGNHYLRLRNNQQT
ncbi:hypothetical protein Acr_22g0003380 [Actinidia rufa]|uniref:Uncharacterized protein n=1 Tax=Actinidia rufa TaxID=165716 RepID=A0A7J0GJF4_9ERIC|nr:hypothetical protein Acr_22g0003380 [Actinidia rufa]